MKKLTALAMCACIALSAAFGQTRQQALDEIARIEKVPEMLRQAWEAGRTQTETVIDTPYGKVTIKFNLDEIIRERYTGAELDFKLRNQHGELHMGINELRINSGSWRNSTQEGMKATIYHELGHHMDKKTGIKVFSDSRYRSVEDFTEIEADAFAMRHIGKSGYTAVLKEGLSSQAFIDAVISRMEVMEREERETLARLRTIANAPASAPPPPPAQKPSVNPAQAFADSAIAAFGRKDYDKMIADYTQAIRIDPNFASAYSNRGSAYAIKGDYDKAIADYNKAIELNPGITSVYSNRGLAYFDKGDYDRAMAEFNQQIRIDPNDAHAYCGRGIVYLKRNDLDRAMAELNHAVRLDPNLTFAYTSRGRVYQKKGDHDRAMADFNKAIRLDPNLADAYTRRGLVYYEKGDHDRAIADYTQAIRLDPKDPDAYQLRGMVYWIKKDTDRAIADFEAVLRLDPNNAQAKEILLMARMLRELRNNR